MLRKYFSLAAVAALALTALPASAWPWRDPGSNGGFGPGPYPPSYYGYPLDDYSAGYYGGGRYREYYSFGRGAGPAISNAPPSPNWNNNPYGYRHPSPEAVVVHPEPVIAVEPVVLLNVQVPADAEVWLDGNKTKQAGANRQFVSPPLQAGYEYTYEVRARWKENGQDVEETRNVKVRTGARLNIAFPSAEANKLPAPRPLNVDAGR
jgi:uncharacterized protein (TIGR03000 family)